MFGISALKKHTFGHKIASLFFEQLRGDTCRRVSSAIFLASKSLPRHPSFVLFGISIFIVLYCITGDNLFIHWHLEYRFTNCTRFNEIIFTKKYYWYSYVPIGGVRSPSSRAVTNAAMKSIIRAWRENIFSFLNPKLALVSAHRSDMKDGIN